VRKLLLDHADAPQNQRVHDPLAEFGFGDQQRPQPIGRDGQGFHRPLGVGVQQHRPACELSHFPDHPARTDGEETPAAARLVVLGEIDLAGQDHEQAVARFADLEQRLTRRIAADLAESPHPLHLRRLHREEELWQGQVGDVPVHLAQSLAQYRGDVGPRARVALQEGQDFTAIEYGQAAIGGGARVGGAVLAVEQGNFAEQLTGAENAEHQRLPVGRCNADPDIAVQHRHHMVARRPLRKDHLAGRKIANANADAGEKRPSFVGFKAGEKPALAQNPAGVLDQTAIGLDFQLHHPSMMVALSAAAPVRGLGGTCPGH